MDEQNASQLYLGKTVRQNEKRLHFYAHLDQLIDEALLGLRDLGTLLCALRGLGIHELETCIFIFTSRRHDCV